MSETKTDFRHNVIEILVKLDLEVEMLVDLHQGVIHLSGLPFGGSD